MKKLEDCKNLTNVELWKEINNRTVLKSLTPNSTKAIRFAFEIEELYKLMEENGYKK